MIKTKRYSITVVSNNLRLILNIFKLNTLTLQHSPIYFRSYFKEFFLKKFHTNTYYNFLKKKIDYKEDNNLVLNLNKSLYFKLYYNISNYLLGPCTGLKFTNIFKSKKSNYLIKQTYPFQILEFPFHKKVYDSFIFFIIFFLTNNYLSFKNDFTLKYSFILKPNNFSLLFFLNRFYFLTYNH